MGDDCWRHAQQMSNAHLVHAAMPTILAMVEALPLTDGVQARGVEVAGKPAELTIDNAIVSALVKSVLAVLDDVCLRLLRESPSTPSLEDREALTKSARPESSPV